MKPTKKTNLFFHLNHFCDDKYDFCFHSNFFWNKQGHLGLKNIKKSIQQIGEKNIKSFVLTGGEPTLNPQFFQILKFLHDKYIITSKVGAFDLSTNAITCSDINFCKKIEKYFNSFYKNFSNIKISFSFSSYKNLSKQKLIDKKIKGIKNLMKISSNIESVIVLTNNNHEHVVDMIKLLIGLNKKRKGSNYYFKLDLRLPYNISIIPSANLEKIILPYGKFINAIKKALDLLLENNIDTTLHNIPLCYIKKYSEFIVNRKSPIGIMVYPYAKGTFICKNIKHKFNKEPECSKCKLSEKCAGIDTAYIKKYKYLKLKAFK